VHATNGQRGKASMHAADEKRLEFIKIRTLPRASGINPYYFHTFLLGRLWNLHVIIACGHIPVSNVFYREMCMNFY